MKNNLRIILATKRMKISELHKMTGISKGTLTAIFYERTKQPSITTFQKISKALDVSIDDLVGGCKQ
ncbi:transcriptional regulator [Ligilactobacillus aviarius]|uniref:helix-turn-helix domain-containing protein n=1 Tax=Ligilactobacillus aviarius TaxID=1606 RepID=UPI0007D93000|nr:helix-turn-helix transcriptional regulator [Ligilactobacillus aviarius]OAQ05328.1 transcriptional regulator [Ligilactobacillus aviarius]OAQ05847.1 transcriptional regulator [Ligilactobacillus aviarius]OAS80682.1 transcriptional regulator [Ligilactobacillus aviarius]PEG71108.1 XRE family transcriptional regulator [Ligilactobacillus aviarius]PEG74233.1 XRE family transcriptional regulator [Ligilactobacillus aviarius]